MIITFKHSGNSGDIVAAMCGIRAVCERMDAKARLYLRLNTPAFYYPGAGKHPIQMDDGKEVMLSEKMMRMLKPLLEYQEYVESVQVWNGEPVMVDLDKIRGEGNVGMPHTPIWHWYGYLFPDMMCDPSQRWMETGVNGTGDYIVVARTSRYTSEFVDFHFLRDLGVPVYFAGLESEHKDFEDRWAVGSERLVVGDFLDLARILKNARLVICNQSMVYNICEAIKAPRLMEVCHWAANCIPVGEGGYSYMHQGGLEYWTRTLLGDVHSK